MQTHDRTAWVELHVLADTRKRYPVVYWFDVEQRVWFCNVVGTSLFLTSETRKEIAAAGAEAFANLERQAKTITSIVLHEIDAGYITSEHKLKPRVHALAAIVDQLTATQQEQP